MSDSEIKNIRQPEHAINELILKRWSARAMNGEIVSDEDLFSVLEAGKWAPSAFNNQPWRFIYAKPTTKFWNKLFLPLSDFNKDWVEKAGALILIISRQKFTHNEKDNQTASFDAGAAWQSLALEATSRGLVVHAMSGFDYDTMRTNLNIPELYKIEAIVALGHPGRLEDLSPELQAREQISSREKLANLIAEGEFKFE